MSYKARQSKELYFFGIMTNFKNLKMLESTNISVLICLAGLIALSFAACTDSPITSEKETGELKLELYEPLLGKWEDISEWKDPKSAIFFKFEKITDTEGKGHWFVQDHSGYCDDNAKYFMQRYFEWTMVDTTLPSKTIRWNTTREVLCEEENNSAVLGTSLAGFKIQGDTMFSGASVYLRVEDN